MAKVIAPFRIRGMLPPPPPDITAPTVNITAPASGSTVTSSTVTITGTASDGAGGSGVAAVEVGLDGQTMKLASGTTSWSKQFIGVTAGNHAITTRARDNAGNWSQIKTSSFNASPRPPAPTGLVVSASARTTAALAWNSAAGATSYNIYRSSSSMSMRIKVNSAPVIGTSYQNPSLVGGVTYYFDVTAVNANGESPPSNKATIIIERPPPASEPAGLYLPIYSNAMRMASEQYNPQLVGLRNLFTANPNSGPFTTHPTTALPDGVAATPQNRPDIWNNIKLLKQQNPACRVLGYIATGNGSQQHLPWKTVTGIKKQVDKWVVWNNQPGYGDVLDGIMWDECDAQDNNTNFIFYQNITGYARSKGLTYIRGNPGTAIKMKRLVSLFDTITFAESSTLLPENEMKSRTFWPEFPKQKFNYLAHTIPASSFTDAWFKMAMKYVGSLYITDDVYSSTQNPWDVASSYLQRQVNLLKEQ